MLKTASGARGLETPARGGLAAAGAECESAGRAGANWLARIAVRLGAPRASFEFGQLGLLVAIMATVALVSGAAALMVLYGVSLGEERTRLIEIGQSHARLIQAMVRHETSERHDPESVRETVVTQLQEALEAAHDGYKLADVLVFRQHGDAITLVVSRGLPENRPLSWERSGYAELVRRALAGVTGTMVISDESGRSLLAAYQPVDLPGHALIAEIDIAALRRPFLEAALVALAASLLIIGVATSFFISASQPMIRRLRESETRARAQLQELKAVYRTAPIGLALLGRDYKLKKANQYLCDIVGYSGNELRHLDMLEITHPDDVEANRELRGALLSGRIDHFRMEKRYIHKDGRPVWVNLSVAAQRVDGAHANFIAVMEDITQRKLAEAQLFHERELAVVTLHSIGDGVITTTAHGIIDYLNPVAEVLTGWSIEEARGRPLRTVFNVIDEHTGAPAADMVFRCIAERRSIILPTGVVLVDRQGREYEIEDAVAPLCGLAGEVLGAVIVFKDVTQSRRMAQQLAYEATHDPLTGLFNRREFEERLEAAVTSARHDGEEHALCYIDLDQFKVINDSAGHAAGDALLASVRSALAGRFRDGDTLARLGGDEFVVLLDRCRLREAVRVAEGIVSAFREWRFTWGETTFQIGASVGVVAVTAASASAGEVLSQADVACDEAKQKGRGRVQVYRREGNEPSQRHAEILVAATLRDALDQQRFTFVCQPIVSLSADRAAEPTHFEVLLRLIGRDQTYLPPAAFIPAAERFGVMSDIDRWVVQTTFRRYMGALEPAHGPTMSINISGDALNQPDFTAYVLETFAATGMLAERVCFEITETAAIQNFDHAAQFCDQVRRLGCRVALDDFGSGLSSFKYLQSLSADFIKIDGSFVRNMISSSRDGAVVAAVNDIGHKLGMVTVAEYACTETLVSTLHSLGVDYAQGDAMGGTVPIEVMLERYGKSEPALIA